MIKRTDTSEVEKSKVNGGYREGSGRPAFVPTEKERIQVQAMSGYGIPEEQIAVMVGDGICVETLKKHFEKELVLGKAKANLGVGKTLYQKAMDGDTAAAIFWAKTQMRWRESQNVAMEHSGDLKISQITRKIIDAEPQPLHPQNVPALQMNKEKQ